MRLRSVDFFRTRLAQRLPGVFKLLGDSETNYLRQRLDHIRLDRPRG